MVFLNIKIKKVNKNSQHFRNTTKLEELDVTVS